MPRRACFCLVLLSTACSVDGIDGVFGSTQSNGGANGEGGTNGAQNGPGGNGGEANGPGVTSGPSSNTVTNGPTTTNGPVTTNGPSTTTGPDPEGVNLYCANAPCAGGEVCCYYQFAKGQDFCASPGECPGVDGWFEIGCNGPADCASGHCCGQWNNRVGWHDIQCAPTCAGADYEMCFDDPGVCNGGACESSQSLGQGYGYCE